jgi:hypothetical protein
MWALQFENVGGDVVIVFMQYVAKVCTVCTRRAAGPRSELLPPIPAQSSTPALPCRTSQCNLACLVHHPPVRPATSDPFRARTWRGKQVVEMQRWTPGPTNRMTGSGHETRASRALPLLWFLFEAALHCTAPHRTVPHLRTSVAGFHDDVQAGPAGAKDSRPIHSHAQHHANAKSWDSQLPISPILVVPQPFTVQSAPAACWPTALAYQHRLANSRSHYESLHDSTPLRGSGYDSGHDFC